MIDKDTQVKDMTKDISEAIHNNTTIGAPSSSSCVNISSKGIAQELYDKDYRKLGGNVVEVVRCKDCRLHEEVDGLIGGTCLYCSHWNHNVGPDEFCNNGW